MDNRASLMKRLVIGKSIGFLVGLSSLLLLPAVAGVQDWRLRIGVLLWYTTLGAVIGLAGVFARHPIFKIDFPWWLRGAALGAWLCFVLSLIAYDPLQAVAIGVFGPDGLLISPHWITVDGAVFGLIVDFVATKAAGEGPATVVRGDPAALAR